MVNCRKLILFFLGSLLCSCGQGNNHQTADTVRHADTIANNPGIATYQKYINTLDTADAGTATLAAKKYKELFSNYDTLINDQAYCIFEKFYFHLASVLNEHFLSAHAFEITNTLVIDSPSTYPPQLAKLDESLKENGFELIESEGDLQINENRDFITKWFYSSVSTIMKKYLGEVNKENKGGFEEDGGLLISSNELSERAIWWENFTAYYPRFVLINEAMQQKQLYLTCLLKGLDNSPVLNYDSHRLTEFFKIAYVHLISKHPDATATKMIKPYYEALLANDTAKANKIIHQYEDQKLLLW